MTNTHLANIIWKGSWLCPMKIKAFPVCMPHFIPTLFILYFDSCQQVKNVNIYFFLSNCGRYKCCFSCYYSLYVIPHFKNAALSCHLLKWLKFDLIRHDFVVMGDCVSETINLTDGSLWGSVHLSTSKEYTIEKVIFIMALWSNCTESDVSNFRLVWIVEAEFIWLWRPPNVSCVMTVLAPEERCWTAAVEVFIGGTVRC